jgi:hypothetical protein
VALSLSLSGFLHSVLPFIPSSSGTTHAETASQKAAAAVKHAANVARREARVAHIEFLRAERLAAHPRGGIR